MIGSMRFRVELSRGFQALLLRAVTDGIDLRERSEFNVRYMSIKFNHDFEIRRTSCNLTFVHLMKQISMLSKDFRDDLK